MYDIVSEKDVKMSKSVLIDVTPRPGAISHPSGANSCTFLNLISISVGLSFFSVFPNHFEPFSPETEQAALSAKKIKINK